MKAHYPVAGSLALLLILALGLLYSTRSVSAAAEGKITGTIKLDGTPAHQRPIDMSKEPNCQKAHAAHPVTTETVVTGPNNTLQYVVVYISEGLPAAAASQVPSETPQWDQKGCQYIPHVMALGVSQLGLRHAEALLAVTVNAAAALGVAGERGQLAPGFAADVVGCDIADWREPAYWVGANLVTAVWTAGLPCRSTTATLSLLAHVETREAQGPRQDPRGEGPQGRNRVLARDPPGPGG